MKLWDKGYTLDERIERFTVGKDRELDLLLAPCDILGTLAHVTMLGQVGLIPAAEVERIQTGSSSSRRVSRTCTPRSRWN